MTKTELYEKGSRYFLGVVSNQYGKKVMVNFDDGDRRGFLFDPKGKAGIIGIAKGTKANPDEVPAENVAKSLRKLSATFWARREKACAAAEAAAKEEAPAKKKAPAKKTAAKKAPAKKAPAKSACQESSS